MKRLMRERVSVGGPEGANLKEPAGVIRPAG